MIAYITGTIVEIEPKSLIVDVNGMGYRVIVGGALLTMAKPGAAITLRTYYHITDNEHLLFGFASKEDLKYFELLLIVPSIGPKTAMNILDAAPPHTLTQAVIGKDMSVLTKISGVGKRTAERIIVELSGKLDATAPSFSSALPVKIQQETVEALVSIGFKPIQAKEKVAQLPADIASVEEAVKAALKTHS